MGNDDDQDETDGGDRVDKIIAYDMIRNNIQIGYITNSFFSSRTYWITDVKEKCVWLVDCGDIEEVMEHLPREVKIVGVLLTHVHFDHIYGLNKLLELFPQCKVYTNAFGQFSLVDPKRNFSRYHMDISDFIFKHQENVIVVGEDEHVELFEGEYARVYETPGHDESCMCFEIEENMFTGDAYIPGKKTITTFPHSSKKKALESDLRISNIARGMIVWPGHTITEK